MSRREMCILGSVILLAAAASAQTLTGSIVGSVKDPSGLAVAGAAVTLTLPATGVERRFLTDERGDFVFTALEPGEYTIRVAAEGFRAVERRSVILSTSETLSVGAIALEVGAVTERVTVSGQPSVVQTASSERAGVITSDQVENIPVIGRNVMELIELLPGVVPGTLQNDAPVNFWRGYVNGSRNTANGFLIDGMGQNQHGINSNTMLNLGMDAVAEVKVLFSNYQAEFGRYSGANVHVVSKSGTRNFHGMGAYFKRHEQFNANDFFNNRLGLGKPVYRYNTWSYNLGGPIYIPGKFNRNRDKLFFFWSQEFWPSKSFITGQTVTVPTALERQGDFSQTLDLNGRVVTVRDPFNNRVVFPGNRIPASRLDKSGQGLLSLFPQPNFPDRSISGGRYNLAFNAERSHPQMLGNFKIDYTLSSRHLLCVSFLYQNDRTVGYRLPNMAPNWNEIYGSYTTNPKQGTLRYHTILSPTLVNELTLGIQGRREWNDFSDEEIARNQRGTAGFTVGQLEPSFNPLRILPNATFGGVTGAANLSYPAGMPLQASRLSYVITDNVTKVAGAHVWKAGFTGERIIATQSKTGNFNGTFAFGTNATNPLDTGFAYANALLGVFTSYTESTSIKGTNSWNTYAEWFAQDTWKVTRRLTLDVGIRFYWLGGRVFRNNLVSGFDFSRYDPAKAVKLIGPAVVAGSRVGLDPVTGAIHPQAAIGAIAMTSGDPINGMVIPAYDKSYPRALFDNPGVQPGPRFGFAFDPTGGGKTAIRGGFGMFYTRNDNAGSATMQQPIVYNPIIYYGTFGALLSSASYIFPQNTRAFDRKGKAPGAYNMSFAVQRHIGFGTVLDVGYVGNLGRHLLWSRDRNAIPLLRQFDPNYADPTNRNVPLSQYFLRPLIGYSEINYHEWAGSSNYHSLQVSANRRMRRNFQFGASWTWSKAMSFADTDGEDITTLAPIRVWHYAMASFDRTHIFKLNYLWSLPGFRRSVAPLRWVSSGWQLSGIASFISGAPLGVGFTQVTATNITGTPSISPRVVVTGNPVIPKSERSFSHNFRTDVFQPPAVGTLGNAARTLIRGPGINNWDMTMVKSFPIRERFRAQIRSEFYNAFNHPQFNAVDTTARFDAQGRQVNTRMGEFTGARKSRVIQMAVRLSF